MKTHNKALHRTAIPLRSIAAGELYRWPLRKSMSHSSIRLAVSVLILGNALAIAGAAITAWSSSVASSQNWSALRIAEITVLLLGIACLCAGAFLQRRVGAPVLLWPLAPILGFVYGDRLAGAVFGHHLVFGVFGAAIGCAVFWVNWRGWRAA